MTSHDSAYDVVDGLLFGCFAPLFVATVLQLAVELRLARDLREYEELRSKPQAFTLVCGLRCVCAVLSAFICMLRCVYAVLWCVSAMLWYAMLCSGMW